jgi:hypothetical protein
LRFADTGAWGIAGANYGTSGQVLKSNGSAAAPAWTSIGAVSQPANQILYGTGTDVTSSASLLWVSASNREYVIGQLLVGYETSNWTANVTPGRIMVRSQSGVTSSSIPAVSLTRGGPGGENGNGLWVNTSDDLVIASHAVDAIVLTNTQTLNQLGTAATPGYSFNGDSDTGMYRDGANELAFSTGGVRRAMIDGTAGGRLLLPDGVAATPGLTFLANGAVGIFRPTTNQIAISTAGVERVRVDASGNVGIGTAAAALSH